MKSDIENLRILTETTFADFPLSSIEQFSTGTLKEYDKVNKQLHNCFITLASLVDLKDYKDEYGKDEAYRIHQPKVWALARKAIKEIKDSRND